MNGKSNVILPVVMIGAVLLSGIGFMGLILSSIEIGDEEKQDHSVQNAVSSELDEVELEAERTFDSSFGQADAVKENAPYERRASLSKGYEIPQGQIIEPKEGSTRSSGDLMDDSEFIDGENIPEGPEVDLTGSFELLEGEEEHLTPFKGSVDDASTPENIIIPGIEDSVKMPVSDEGMEIDKDDEVMSDAEMVGSDISQYLGDNTPDVDQAGISKDDLADMVWSVSNKTTRDEDGDGYPESISEVRVASGSRNDTLLNGTLIWIAGYEYFYQDKDSDGVPDMESIMVIRYANYTISGKTIAQGISYSSILKNDTDGDGIVDHREIRHLSFGSRATLIGTLRSYASAGELLEDDRDGDGAFENKEATAVFYYKHETTNVTLRETVVIVSAKVDPLRKEISDLHFNRNNSTAGQVLLETGYIRSYKESPGSKELVVIGARNNTVTGRIQYAVLNITERGYVSHLTAFALDNRSLLLGGSRSDAFAVDLKVTETGDNKTETGFLAASRFDDRPMVDTESFLVISFMKDSVSGNISYENTTIIAGKNTTMGSSLNSTMGYLFHEYRDQDLDGNPELMKDAIAVSHSRDADSDGIKEWESYFVRMTERWDNNSDGVLELNHTFTMMGIKSDPDDDGFIDNERGLMIDVKQNDANSNGFLELVEEGMIGFSKTDNNSDGLIDDEIHEGFWKRITDTYDDGAEVNEISGTWTERSP